MRRSGDGLLIILLVVAVAAGGVWYYWQKSAQTTVESGDAPPADVAPAMPPRTGPLHPLEASLPPAQDLELVPLPPLDDLDAYLRLEAINIFGDALDQLLANERLIDRFVATVDNLPRPRVAERIRPLDKLASTFTVDSNNDDDSIILSPANFERYTFLIDMLRYADIDSMIDAYRRFYPAFQKAYVQLGYPDGYFNDRLIEVIDHLLATPQPEQPIRLTRPRVLYEYADADTEALSSGQKLMLRIGDEQAGILRNVLTEVRARIATR